MSSVCIWTVCFRFVFSAISKTVSFWNLLGPFWWLVVVINDILLLLSKCIFCQISFVDLNWGMRARVYFETVCPCIPVLNKVQLFFDLLWATAVIPVNISFLWYDSVSVCSDETSPLVDVCFIVDNCRFYCHKVSWVVDTLGAEIQCKALVRPRLASAQLAYLQAFPVELFRESWCESRTKKMGGGAVALVLLSRRTRAESLLFRLARSMNLRLRSLAPYV